MNWTLWVFLASWFCLIHCAEKKSKVVSTLLNAKWQRTPFMLEASEFLAEENNEFFWSFLEYFAEADNVNLADKITDEELYNKVIEFCSRYLSKAQMKLLKFELSLHTNSPKVEMFQQIARDRGVHLLGCDTVVDIDGELSCDLPEKFAATEKSATIEIEHDHKYVNWDDDAKFTVVLYGEMGTERVAEFHKTLSQKASRGEVKYIFRHFYHPRPNAGKLRLSGYGVELQLKSSEYKAQDDRKIKSDGQEFSDNEPDEKKGDEINGFDFGVLGENYPADKEKLDEFKQFLLDENNPTAPLKVWQLQDLSLQTAARVLSSPVDQQLSVLMDLSQNFPSYARPLSKTSVPKELKKEVKKNRDNFFEKMSLQPTDAALFINGLHFDMDYVDVFTLLDTIKTESKVMDGLGRLGIKDDVASKFTSLDFSTSNKVSYGVDVRDTAVNWINDIEKDKMYQGWPEGVMEMLRPTFPGMMRSVRKNFFNIVVICDPSKAACRPVLKMLESFYLHRAPTRIGLVFAVNADMDAADGSNDAGVALLNAFNYVKQHASSKEALAFITSIYENVEDESLDLTVQDVQDQFKSQHGANKAKEVFEAESEYDVGRALAKDFMDRTGLLNNQLPQALMNGVPMDAKTLNSEDFEEALMMTIMKETNVIQRAIYRNQLRDEDDCLDYLMKQSHIMPRLNSRILNNDEPKYLDLTGESLPSLKLETFSSLVYNKNLMSGTLARHLKYVNSNKDSSKLHVLSAWIVADLESQQGRQLVRGALAQLKSSSQLRVAVIYNHKGEPGMATKITKAAFESQGGNNLGLRNILSKLLKEDTIKNLGTGKKKMEDFDIPGADMEKFGLALKSVDDEEFQIHRIYAEKALGFGAGDNGLLINGKVIGPLASEESFGADDFNLLDKFSMGLFGEKLVNGIYNNFPDRSDKSDLAMKLSTLLVSRPEGKTRSEIQFYSDKTSVIKVEPSDPSKPSFDLVAVVDPVSQGAQKIAAVLNALKQVLNARIRVFLNCVDKHSELPQKSYFRLVLEPELSFAHISGDLSAGPMAKFSGLPEDPIYTMHYHIPDNWLIEPVKSVYDLDNIKLADVEGSVIHSEFELEYLLLEGHCFEAYTGNPPRGLQLTLGTKAESVVMDTIVMANLGYLQLKSSPGRWLLSLREGRSAELYDIASIDGKETSANEDLPIMISSFQSKIVKLRVAKKADKRDEELLQSDRDPNASGGSLWSSITSTFSGADDGGKSEDEPLNIFCLASGHLYERLLRIMMLSVLRTTKAPVKFWILKSYLSPTLKEFLPHYAEKYGFQYEYVQYKWPRWLNQQSEKQRIIWGYKILFLDVMFPLDVKKIIFVDTDQIVRADLTELRDMDLKGAPYGYTPFCDSNKDMEGFRFWKQGYWKNHLAGRKYHISALYVVDLVKFRQVAAGDRLRGQYQALSQDPNSLANLDQDLPNNMIHQVPIFSLPQEWLYCETWCDKSELANAKSIDLCNNPLTKEPKLMAARRIVSEWTSYDDEMTQLSEDLKDKKQTTLHTEL